MCVSPRTAAVFLYPLFDYPGPPRSGRVYSKYAERRALFLEAVTTCVLPAKLRPIVFKLANINVHVAQ